MFKLSFLKRAFDLSLDGRPGVKWNPPVGAVLVLNNEIVSEGYHSVFGGDHAEVTAINNFSGDLSKCDLYVTLEPCCFEGKTPACTDLIIKSGIKNVYIGVLDPNPLVSGNGVKVLTNAGVNVEVLQQNDLCDEIHNSIQYFKNLINDKPYITLKAAVSLDGKITDNSSCSKWITSMDSRVDANYERSCYDCVIVGSGTVISDNCNLGSNDFKDPFRVIIDNDLSTDPFSNVYRDDNYLIACSDSSDVKPGFRMHNLVKLGNKRVNIPKLVEFLFYTGKKKIFIEGGSAVFGSFYDSFLEGDIEISELLFYYSPILIGGFNSKSVIGGNGLKNLDFSKKFLLTDTKKIGDDFKLRYLIR